MPLARVSCSMLESVANLKKKAKKGPTAGNGAFQQLFLLVGMHLFKVPHAPTDGTVIYIYIYLYINIYISAVKNNALTQVNSITGSTSYFF